MDYAARIVSLIQSIDNLNLANDTNQSQLKPNRKPKLPPGRLDPIARVLLIAVYDNNHVLSIFRQNKRYLLKHPISKTTNIEYRKH